MLMLLNAERDKVTIPQGIKIAQQVTYLGVQISKSLSSVARINYTNIFRKIENDINRWMPLPASVPSRISTVKMNILPRINFISSMLPLAPPANYWLKLDSLLSKFIWNGKRPRVKWTTLQLKKSQGGWACPNFKIYHWSFVLRCLSYWLNPEAHTPWKDIERELIAPMRLQDLLFSGISHKK